MVTAEELVAAATAARLDVIGVTDHDTMAAVAEAQARGQEAGLEVIAGQEITTRWPAQTHIVGWYLTRPVRRGMSLEDTVAAIHDQGGLAVVPHPFMPFYFGSIQPSMLLRLIERHPVDGIELMFTAPLGSARRRVLKQFYDDHRSRLGAALGGSDCHFGRHDIARIVTAFDGDFRAAVESRSTRPQKGAGRGRVPVSLAARQQWRSLVELPVRRARGQL